MAATPLFLLMGLLGLAALLWGLRRIWLRRRANRQRQMVEDALKYLLERELEAHPAAPEALAGALRLSRQAAWHLLAAMQQKGLVQSHGARLALTPAGRQWAAHVLRAHRLWERYLADEARLPLEDVHQAAHRWEHQATPESLDRLEAHLGYPRRDPHGDPIPRRGDVPPPITATPLTDWPEHTPGVIAHLEDEPPVAFRQIAAAGLRLGQHVHVEARGPHGLRLSDGRRVYRLPLSVAANIYLRPPTEQEALPDDAQPLHLLPDQQPAQVVALAPWLQGFTRRRLMDLGITPGAKITPVLRPFFGDPRAYRVRGTTIALRQDQAAAIFVRPLSDA